MRLLFLFALAAMAISLGDALAKPSSTDAPGARLGIIDAEDWSWYSVAIPTCCMPGLVCRSTAPVHVGSFHWRDSVHRYVGCLSQCRSPASPVVAPV